MTYTFVLLELSKAAYDEIRRKLENADYHHAFTTSSSDGRPIIDMHGIAIAQEPEK